MPNQQIHAATNTCPIAKNLPELVSSIELLPYPGLRTCDKCRIKLVEVETPSLPQKQVHLDDLRLETLNEKLLMLPTVSDNSVMSFSREMLDIMSTRISYVSELGDLKKTAELVESIEIVDQQDRRRHSENPFEVAASKLERTI